MISKQEFESYYTEYVDKIYNYVWYKIGNDDPIASDLTSDVFYKALKKLSTFDSSQSSFKTWIYTIAHNTITDYFRDKKEVVDLEEMENMLCYYDGIDQTIDQEMKLKQVYIQLNELPSTTKQIIILRVFENMSFQEISQILGLSQWACKMQFKRGVNHIQAILLQLVLIFLIF